MDRLYESSTFKETLLVWDQKDAGGELRKVRIECMNSGTMDIDYKKWLLYILDKSETVVQRKQWGGKDPEYEQFLKCLTEYGKSYVLNYERNGESFVVKYEENPHLNEDFDREPRRKLSSSVKQLNESSNQMPGVGNQYEDISESSDTKPSKRRILRRNSKTDDKESTKYTSNGRPSDYATPRRTVKVEHEGNESLFKNFGGELRTRLRSGMKQKSLDNQCKHDGNDVPSSKNETKGFTGRKSRNKVACEMVQDSDYLRFLESCVIKDDHFDYISEDLRISYGVNVVQHIKVNSDQDNESLSDVEIIADSTEGINCMNGNILNAIPAKASGFREQLTKLLKRTYDKREHDKLWRDIQLRRPIEQIKDLRYGRERKCLNKIDGKSYLDRYPDLNRKLLQYKHDKPTCLNLLRGFFFWLQNGAPITKEEGSFFPWKDADCISIKPGSR